MTITAFILIILSAFFHASWNTMAKKSVMTKAFYTAICVTACLTWLHVQFWTPIKVLSLPGLFFLYTALSVTSDVIYCIGLVRSYRVLDMSTAYPMMRSLPILITALITTLLHLGKPLTPMAIFGMCIVLIGCLTMPLKKFSDFSLKNYLSKSLVYVLITACGTTGYTIFDSQAMTVLRDAIAEYGYSKPIVSLTYYSTRGIMLSTTLLIIVFSLVDERKNFKEFFTKKNPAPLLAGFFASLTYVLVLIAMNYVTNVSYVQVFRQAGLLISLFLGVFVLKEKCTVTKVAGVILIITGLILSVLKL